MMTLLMMLRDWTNTMSPLMRVTVCTLIFAAAMAALMMAGWIDGRMAYLAEERRVRRIREASRRAS